MVEPLEFQREYLRSNLNSDTDFGLETMIDASLKYRSYDNVTSCTLYRPGLSGAVKFGANMLDDSYSEGEGYSITICDVFKNPQHKFICIEDEDASSIDINFCPICGRKL